MNRTARIVLPAILLLTALSGAAYMLTNKVTPERAPAHEQVVPVEILEVSHCDEQVVVTAQGTVTAAQQVQLMPEVGGRLVELSPQLVPGGVFAAGELVARIDPRDYEARVAAQQEAVAAARLLLRQERARQRVAEQEWELLDGSIPEDQEDRELALRLPQIEQAEAAQAAAEGALAKARLDLERCSIVAPFEAVVISEKVDLGQVVNPQTPIATLVGTEYYWVQVSLPVEDLVWIDIPDGTTGRGSPARVIHHAGAVEVTRSGRVARLLGDVDPAGRLARLLVVIENPLESDPASGESALPLLIGSYVTVEIEGHTVHHVVRVPRMALREVAGEPGHGTTEGVWIMDSDDRLAIHTAEVVWRAEQTVLVRNGFEDGERIVTSTISTPIEGMKLTVTPPSRVGG